MFDYPEMSENACTELLRHIFGKPEATLAVIAPEGWERSPLLRVYHPTPDQQYEEALQFHENITHLTNALRKNKGEPPQEDAHPPTRAEFDKPADKPIEPLKEWVRLLATCVWDVFSNNHTVLSSDGKAYHLGSFRGSGRFIADFLNEANFTEDRFDYLDFYCGSIWIDQRADLTPVYEYIFQKLREKDCDWVYSHPRTYLVSFEKEENSTKPEDYNPQEAILKEMEQEKRREELDKLQADLDEAAEASKREALESAPVPIIRGYLKVFGQYPPGWA